ncbi:MAG: helix-turn-helix domain-containing protein [Eubacteriales bacterium]
MTFAEKLQTARKQLFLSQEAIAKELGVSFATVNRWEKGKCEPGYKAQKAFNDFCIVHNILFDTPNVDNIFIKKD